MEKRAFLAVILSLLILVVYQEWLARQYDPKTSEEPQQEIELKKPAVEPRVQPEIKAATQELPSLQPAVKEVRLETDRYVAVFTSKGARLKSFALKQYRTSVEEKSPPVEIITDKAKIPYPLGIRVNSAVPYDDANLIYAVTGNDLRLSGDAKGTLTFEGVTPAGFAVRKKLTFTGSRYTFDVDVTVEDTGNANPSLVLTSQPQGPSPDSHFEGFLGVVGKKLIRESGEALQKGMEHSGVISWVGFGYTYFLLAVLPDASNEEKVIVREVDSAVTLELSSLATQQHASKSHYTLFIGPKDLDMLKSLERGLERSIDFGYFSVVSMPLLYLLRFSHWFTGSYGLDIMLLTVLIKLLTAPLTHKSYASMKQMQKLQPQMERLKEKFKDDREKLNKEIMELYRRNKVNPLGGCLPMVLQIPVFIALYNALLTPIELRHAPFMWIKDLSRPDWESLPVNIAGWSVGFPVLTILMGASMFIQQWMTPSAGDPNQRRMMMLMPIMFTVMFVNFPSGLTIYWLVNNVLSIAQQYLVNRMDR
jgi:YidC/Oxa1 family membrane protein insertase